MTTDNPIATTDITLAKKHLEDMLKNCKVGGYEGRNQAIDQLEQNILKALEEV